MASSLASISKKRVPLSFPLKPYGGEGDINLIYKPNSVSAKDIRKMMKDTEGQMTPERTIALFVLKVESWDATGADGKAIPITKEALGEIEPWQLLDDILAAILEDQEIDPKTASD